MFGFGGTNTADAKIRVGYDGKEADKGLEGTTKKLDLMNKAIKGAFTIAAITMVAKYATALAVAGGEASEAEERFSKMARARGRDSDTLLKDMRRVTEGVVSDIKLQQTAIRAMIIGLSTKDFTTILEYSTKFAKATGGNVEEAINTAVEAVARGSARSLVGMGIQIKGANDTIGAAIDQMREKMGSIPGAMDSASDSADTMATSWANLTSQMGKTIAVPMKWFFDQISAGLKDSAETLDGWGYIWGRVFGGSNWKKIEDIRRLSADKRNEAIDTRKTEIGIETIKLQQELTKYEEKYKGSKIFVDRRVGITKDKINDLKVEFVELEKLRVATGAPSIEDKTNIKTEKDEKPKAAKTLYSIEFGQQAREDAEEYKKWLESQQAALSKIKKDGYDEQLEAQREYFISKLDEVEQWTVREMDKADELRNNGVITAQQYEDELTRIKKEAGEKRLEEARVLQQKEMDLISNSLNSMSSINNSMVSLSDMVTQREIKNLDKRAYTQEAYDRKVAQIQQEGEERARVFARIEQGILLAKTIMYVANAVGGAMSAEPGEAIAKIIAGIAVGAEGAVQIAAISAQHFQGGFLGEVSRMKKGDSIPAMIGSNEAVIPGPQTAMHYDELKAIKDNTANTAAGMRGLRGGTVINNFNSVSTEQMLIAQRNNDRRARTGTLI